MNVFLPCAGSEVDALPSFEMMGITAECLPAYSQGIIASAVVQPITGIWSRLLQRPNNLLHQRHFGGHEVNPAQDRDHPPIKVRLHMRQRVQDARMAASTDQNPSVTSFEHQGHIILIRVRYEFAIHADGMARTAPFGVCPFLYPAAGPKAWHYFRWGII